MIQGRLPDETDWDTLTKTGMYYVSGFNTSYVNFPTGAYLYGILLVFNPVPFGVMQVYSPDNENYPYIYVRIKKTLIGTNGLSLQGWQYKEAIKPPY